MDTEALALMAALIERLTLLGIREPVRDREATLCVREAVTPLRLREAVLEGLVNLLMDADRDCSESRGSEEDAEGVGVGVGVGDGVGVGVDARGNAAEAASIISSVTSTTTVRRGRDTGTDMGRRRTKACMKPS